MRRQIIDKLEVLADAAKYDVSCSSSGSRRKRPDGGVGDTSGAGICHTFTADGRCVSLLKILFTNHCIYDCAYCVSRRSSDVARVAFTVEEVVELTLDFYRRNYIEGLFLSSGIFRDADTTSERLVRVAQTLRREHRFGGYIHLKIIPGTSPELVAAAGRYADRVSVNMEIPSEEGLKAVAPEKSYADVLGPMDVVREGIDAYQGERRLTRGVPVFAPAGQTTQLVVGATPETDAQVLALADGLYRGQQLRRVYYSAFVPVTGDPRVAALDRAPVRREHRLYQADWLLRHYGFSLDEVVPEGAAMLDEALDPKTAYALRRPWEFPLDVNTAPYERLVRIPGVGVRSARRIVAARRHGLVRWEHLHAMGVVLRRAQHFLYVPGHRPRLLEADPEALRVRLAARAVAREAETLAPQLNLFLT